MDRVLVGKATTNTTSSYYHRTDQHGLFVSKPGANVQNCPDGDLIFDSTAAGLIQVLGRGRASVPKQLYDRGLFGEPGTITEDNWNSAGTVPVELNSKTSWLFDALGDVQEQIKRVIYTTTVPKWSRDFKTRIFTPDLGFFDETKYASMMDFGDIGADEYVRTMIKNLWRIQEDVFPFLSNFPLVTPSFNTKMCEQQVPSYSIDDTLTTTTGTPYGTVGSVPNASGTISITVRDGVGDLIIPAYAGILKDPVARLSFDDNLDTRATPREPIDEIKVLSSEEIQVLIDDDAIFNLLPVEWKNAWASYHDQNSSGGNQIVYYPNKTAWGAGQEVMKRNEPRPWRALSSVGDDTSAVAEKKLMVLFFQYQFILSWVYNNFGVFVNNDDNPYGPFDWNVRTTLNFIRKDSSHQSGVNQDDVDDYNQGQVNPFYSFSILGENPYLVQERSLPDYQVDAGTTPKNFIEYTSTQNWKYTKWTGGSIDISTGIESPNDTSMPVQILWNTISRDTGNTVTNLSFLNIRDNLFKSSTASERLTALKPGIPTITGNTYIENNEIKLKFEQPSTEDTVEIYYTVFSENAFQDFAGAVDSLVFNITDVNDPNYPGDNYAGKRQQEPTWTAMNQSSAVAGTSRSDYGRYYNVVFPDDFVKDKGTTTDPFKGYRNANGIIDYPLHITLNIPQGVQVGSNSYSELITYDQLQTNDDGPTTGPSDPVEYSRGTNIHGPLDPAGRGCCDRDAMIDPCIFLNLHSGRFTDRALQGLKIRIENNGELVGGGGYGQYGQMDQPDKSSDPTSREKPGGGGGGGAGYHPPWVLESPQGDPNIPGDPGWAGELKFTASDYNDSISSTTNTQPGTDGTPHPDWVWHFLSTVDDKAQYSLRDEYNIQYPGGDDAENYDNTRPATSQVEKIAHKDAISLFWNGPNNYVEWGMGDERRANNNNTGMDQITIKSIAPGKGGTGYMGTSPNQGESGEDHPGAQASPRWTETREQYSGYTTRPYWDTILEKRDSFGRYFDDRYPRIMGTYQMQFLRNELNEWVPEWLPRFPKSNISGTMGSQGDPGTETSGGAGGAKSGLVVFGSDQDTYNRCSWGGDDPGNQFNQGLPAAGVGGSVVYLYSNTYNSISGVHVEMVNNETGIIKSGGGGGSGGGSDADGLAGGNLGRPGKWYTGGGTGLHDVRCLPQSAGSAGHPTATNDSYFQWSNYTIRGEPGRLVWWNTSNVTSNYTIENKSKKKNAAIEGMDYNSGISGWDYVSYLPDLNVTRVPNDVPWVTTGLKLWGRKLNGSGDLVYTKLNEQTFEEYLTSIGATVIGGE